MDAHQQQEIVERFNTDKGFRRRVLEDATGAVKQEFGVDLPFPARVVADGEGYRIEPVTSESGDLSDEQLDLVAGGKGGGGAPPVNRVPAPPNAPGLISVNHPRFR